MIDTFPHLPPERFRGAPFKDVSLAGSVAARQWWLNDDDGFQIEINADGSRFECVAFKWYEDIHVVGRPAGILYGVDGSILEDFWVRDGESYEPSAHERLAWLAERRRESRI